MVERNVQGPAAPSAPSLPTVDISVGSEGAEVPIGALVRDGGLRDGSTACDAAPPVAPGEHAPAGCLRCGEAATEQSGDGTTWCRGCDWRRYCLDLAQLVDYPAVRLDPIRFVVRGGVGAWQEFVCRTAGATLYVAIRKLRARCGGRAEQVAPSAAPSPAWKASSGAALGDG